MRTKRQFDPETWEQLVSVTENDPRCPHWLKKALVSLGHLAPWLRSDPKETDESRFDMTYPH